MTSNAVFVCSAVTLEPFGAPHFAGHFDGPNWASFKPLLSRSRNCSPAADPFQRLTTFPWGQVRSIKAIELSGGSPRNDAAVHPIGSIWVYLPLSYRVVTEGASDEIRIEVGRARGGRRRH